VFSSVKTGFSLVICTVSIAFIWLNNARCWTLLFIWYQPQQHHLLCSDFLFILQSLHGRTADLWVIIEILHCYILLRTCPCWHAWWWSCQYSCWRSSSHAQKPDIWMTSRHWCSWLSPCSCFLLLARWFDPYTRQQIIRCETISSGVAVFTSSRKGKSYSHTFG
jgi:hypothetical protein